MPKTHNAAVNQTALIKPSDEVTVVMPASPANGDWVEIITIEDDLTALTIDPNGIPVEGSAAVFDLIWPNSSIQFLYSSTSNIWWVREYNQPDVPNIDVRMTGWNPGSLGAGWVDAEFDATPNAQRYMLYLPPSDVIFYLPGLYQFAISGVFEHNSSNQGRTTNMRWWNETDQAVIGSSVVISTGRNAEASNFSIIGLISIDSSLTEKFIRLQFGGGDSYSSVIFNSGGVTVLGVDVDLAAQANRQAPRQA